MFANNTRCRVAMRGTTGSACRKKQLALQVAWLLSVQPVFLWIRKCYLLYCVQ